MPARGEPVEPFEQRSDGWDRARSLSNNSFLETKNATQYPAYSTLDFVVELLTSLHSPNYAYRLEYCLSDRLLGLLAQTEWRVAVRQAGQPCPDPVVPSLYTGHEGVKPHGIPAGYEHSPVPDVGCHSHQYTQEA